MSSPKYVANAVTVWGAALYAIRVVTANLLRDGTPAAQMAAVHLAQSKVRRVAAEELWWVRNREVWLRDRAPTPPKTYPGMS